MLVGRAAELARLDRLLSDIRRGLSRALVVTGDVGIGKTALLDEVAARATGCRVVRGAGAHAEVELAFAGVHQICSPLIDHLGRIPEPQRDALRVTFGFQAGPAPDPFLVGVAVLSLVADAAADRPLLCVVDDAQWLDDASAQVLGFVARRLGAESVALLFGRRDTDPGPALTGVPEMVLRGLRPEDAEVLLRTVVRGPLDDRVRDRMVRETGGNPLALLELPRGLTQAQLAPGLGLGTPSGLSRRIEESFEQRLAQLPVDQRRLLQLAAADPLGDPLLLWRAAQRLGLPAQTLGSRELEGLVQDGARVTFRHPLVRSAAYRSASPQERREVHRVLAEETDPATDVDRRAWHLALAAAGPDDEVAAELERCADRAQARGGIAASAAFLERAAELTDDPAARAGRALAAAEAKNRAGAPSAALELLALAQAGPLDQLQLARLDMLRAQIAYVQNRGDDAAPLLLRAAKRLEPLDLPLARDTYLDALAAANFAGGGVAGGMVAAGEAALRAPTLATTRPQDLLLEGLAVLFTDGYTAGVPLLAKALAMFVGEGVSGEDALRWNWLAARTAVELWDFDAWLRLGDRMVDVARDVGAMSALPLGFALQTGTRIYAGDLAASAAINAETAIVLEATGLHMAPYGAFFLAAWRGREAEASAIIDAAITDATSRGEGFAVAAASTARAILLNGLGRHDEALAAAERGSEHAEDMAFHNWSLVELVEAGVHSGQGGRANEALEVLAERTGASGSDWALGVEARCRALVAPDDDAEVLYQEAIARLDRTGVQVELARSHLVFGEWLQQERRPSEAQLELRRAYEMCTTMGLEAFAERARRGLVASGDNAGRRALGADIDLTDREAQVARLASEGLSNPEIGARLFLSARTVEWHLRHVFTKLGVRSRTQLTGVLGARARFAGPS